MPEWIEEVALGTVRARIESEGIPAEVKVEDRSIILSYEQAAARPNEYVPAQILIEFGARATGEPLEVRSVSCDAAEHLPMLAFPTASPRVMAPERTFWEKATAAHAFCLEERLRGDRYARHWYDLVRLDDAGIVATALEDRELGRKVARHKNRFFIIKAANGETIDYETAVDGALSLVPDGKGRSALEDDYERMVEAGLLEENAPSFDEIMERCAMIEAHANSV